jgi:hypothetical protein
VKELVSKRTKAKWQALRRRYTWHLRPPFRNSFDRCHWWHNQSEIEPVAALYELARRHPFVRDQWLRAVALIRRNNREILARPGSPVYVDTRFSRIITREHWFSTDAKSGRVPPSLYWTCLLGLKSWAKLDYTDRMNWRSIITLKGLDFRTWFDQCQSINDFAEWKIRYKREDAMGDKVKGKMRPEIGSIVTADLATNPPPVEEREAAIASSAVDAYRRGALLFALAPDLTAKTAGSAIAKAYHWARRRHGRPQQRARWQDWLPLIAAFEDAETSQGAYSQTFARYRRALDSIDFD